jgi:photosystem II stability/assembly factor-like uncharacterized protein
VRRRLLLLGAAGLLAIGGLAACGDKATNSTQISTVVPHINPKVHRHLLARLAKQHARTVKRRVRVAQANAGTPNSIAFWDAERGLVGGGYSYQRQCAGTVSLTTDGGRSFHVMLRRRAAVTWVDTAGTDDAWAQLDRCRRHHRGEPRPQLWHSSDGGQSWHRVSTSLAWNPSFASPTRGFAVAATEGGDFATIADTGKLLSTSNGGQSWHPASGPCRHSDGAAVSAPTVADVWVVCTEGTGAGGQGKTVYASTNGGGTWRAVAHGHPESSPTGPHLGGYVQGLSFSNAGSGILTYSEGGYFLYQTQDGGHHWQTIRSGSLPTVLGATGPNGQAGSANSAVMLSPTTGFVLLGYRAGLQQLALTEDAGQSWIIVHHWPPPHVHE